jgi:hypothetical protein
MFPGSQGERGPIRQTQKFPVAAQKTTLPPKLIAAAGNAPQGRSCVIYFFPLYLERC